MSACAHIQTTKATADIRPAQVVYNLVVEGFFSIKCNTYTHTNIQNTHTWSKCTFDTGGVQPGCGRLLLHQAQHHTNACTHTKHARVVQMHVRHRWCTTWLWEATSPSSATSYQHIHTYTTRTRSPIAHSTQVVYNLVVEGYFSIKRNIIPTHTHIQNTHT